MLRNTKTFHCCIIVRTVWLYITTDHIFLRTAAAGGHLVVHPDHAILPQCRVSTLHKNTFLSRLVGLVSDQTHVKLWLL
jgi:hypothetical protein